MKNVDAERVAVRSSALLDGLRDIMGNFRIQRRQAKSRNHL